MRAPPNDRPRRRARSSLAGRIARHLVAAALLLVAVLARALSAWIAWTQHVRALRETQSAEPLAGGQGRWVDVGDAQLYVQEWGRPTDPALLLTHGTGAWPGVLLRSRALRTTLVSATATWPGLTGPLLRRFVHRRDAVTDALLPAYRLPFARAAFSQRLGDWAAAFSPAACESADSLRPERLTRWTAQGLPVALVWGEEDRITPLAQGRALQRWMPGATLTVLPGVGHIPHIESPEAFATALIGALGPPR